MLYPLKFKPVYKDYVWGGRNFEKLGKQLPEGIVAESWEVSCHKNGTSIVANGEFEGITLPNLIKLFGRALIGSELPEKDVEKFPLLVKFIDADKNLSVQVHPGDSYARANENGEYGKNEMWYIIAARPGAKLVYDVRPGITREAFAQAVRDNKVESCLKSIEVFPGDAINIPSGLIHAIGQGIMLAEVQQNSDTTYRVYDYGRTDRPLHIEKALDVIDFNSAGRKEKYEGLELDLGNGSSKKHIIATDYFSVEVYNIDGTVTEYATGGKFYIYTVFEGSGGMVWDTGSLDIKAGESLLIPAALGKYALSGRMKALKCYVPNIKKDVLEPLVKSGYGNEDIIASIGGLAVK
ncbi:MAG: class I mannose-6-phosphate isomerase [Ruminiclostridium sp.]|nr:class I mannose-6-phosphate isomerase [Ruminiclostridium sp.]